MCFLLFLNKVNLIIDERYLVRGGGALHKFNTSNIWAPVALMLRSDQF